MALAIAAIIVIAIYSTSRSQYKSLHLYNPLGNQSNVSENSTNSIVPQNITNPTTILANTTNLANSTIANTTTLNSSSTTTIGENLSNSTFPNANVSLIRATMITKNLDGNASNYTLVFHLLVANNANTPAIIDTVKITSQLSNTTIYLLTNSSNPVLEEANSPINHTGFLLAPNKSVKFFFDNITNQPLVPGQNYSVTIYGNASAYDSAYTMLR